MEKDTLLELWEKLLDEGCDEAAAGLLCDLFRFLDYTETKWPATAPGTSEEADREMREGRWGQLREVLMELFDDGDGTKLKNWFQLYRNDIAAFRARARQFARGKNDIHDSGLWLDGSESSSS